jgi:hypothetical protein
VDHAHFPWRPLGVLLVERGLLTAAELDQALAEQRRSGRLLGQVLVQRGYVGGPSLACALAEQHGVGLHPMSAPEARASADTPPRRAFGAQADRTRSDDGPWRPLGTVLVEKGFVSEAELKRVLAEQKQRPARRLGEILVEGGYISGPELALALAEQHGVDLGSEDELGQRLATVLERASPGQPTYRVRAVAYEPAYRSGSVLYQSTSFLEAADFACELVQRENPAALEIEKVDGAVRETVWTYSEARASAEAAARENLVGIFGFDPVRWDTRRQFDSGTNPP